MKPEEIKLKFVELRANNKSYTVISKELHISKATCSKWEKDLEDEIARAKAAELNLLYDSYYMTREAKIKRIGGTLNRIEDELAKRDLDEVPTEKLLDLKLKYSETLSKEYVSPSATAKGVTLDREGILGAFEDLLNRVRAGEVSTEQASRESLILGNFLKAYETVELRDKLATIEAVVGSR